VTAALRAVLLVVAGIVASACAAEDAASGAGASAGEGQGASPPPAAEPIVETTNRGWIGGACASNGECPYEGGFCLGAEAGFPRGLCSQRCESICPDRDGADVTQTFCVADRDGLGTCVSRCDFTKLPGSGCRDGYGCARVSRMGDPDKVEGACLPNAVALNDLQPAVERAVRAAELEDERIVLMELTEGRPALIGAVHATSPVYPASVIKVVVMAEVERQIERALLTRTERLTITDEQDTCDSLPDGDTRPTLESGDSATIDELVAVMITRSDNTATNALIDRIGRANATTFMKDLGLSSLQVHRKVFGCEPYDDSGWDGASLNTMTALDTATLYRLILDGGPGFVGVAGRQRMRDVLADQRWRGGIGATLPDDAQYLSKTGDTSKVVHDSGIILWQGRRFIVVAFTELAPSVGRPRLKTLGAEITKIMSAR
jgi:beta-lactamase class A